MSNDHPDPMDLPEDNRSHTTLTPSYHSQRKAKGLPDSMFDSEPRLIDFKTSLTLLADKSHMPSLSGHPVTESEMPGTTAKSSSSHQHSKRSRVSASGSGPVYVGRTINDRDFRAKQIVVVNTGGRQFMISNGKITLNNSYGISLAGLQELTDGTCPVLKAKASTNGAALEMKEMKEGDFSDFLPRDQWMDVTEENTKKLDWVEEKWWAGHNDEGHEGDTSVVAEEE